MKWICSKLYLISLVIQPFKIEHNSVQSWFLDTVTHDPLYLNYYKVHIRLLFFKSLSKLSYMLMIWHLKCWPCSKYSIQDVHRALHDHGQSSTDPWLVHFMTCPEHQAHWLTHCHPSISPQSRTLCSIVSCARRRESGAQHTHRGSFTVHHRV